MIRQARHAVWVALITSAAAGAQEWEPLGPAPLLFGGTENIENRPSSGAIHAVATHPSDADIVYVASVGGGIWKTVNATAASPTWVQQTDGDASLNFGDIAFDAADATGQTLAAGTGRFSSFGRRGGARAGALRTTDGGTTWAPLDSSLQGRNITKVTANGNFILVGVDIADSFTCGNIGLFRSTDNGVSFARVEAASGLAGGAVDALAQDPVTPATLYASVFTFDSFCGAASGIYKSTDNGANWARVGNGAIDALFPTNASTGTLVEIAVGRNNNVYVAVAPNTTGQLAGVFRSGDGGSSWTEMDLPGTDENGFVGIHPGGQGGLHMSLVADPNDANVVYIGGDRQPLSDQDSGSFPNSIGAQNFSGRLFRGDASQPAGSQWEPLTHSGTASNSSPHADSRDMAFDANGVLLQGDDGGVYRRTSPTDAAGDWFDLNGNLQITEQHSMRFDRLSRITVSGNQDNGATRQNTLGSAVWNTFQSGDGGDIAIDNLTSVEESTRFVSSQFLGAPRRLRYDQDNVFLGQTSLSLTPLGGSDPIAPQFTTPMALNQIDGNRLVIGGANAVYESLDQGDTVSALSPAIQTIASGRDTIAYGATGNADLLFVAGADITDPNNPVLGLYRRVNGGDALSRVFDGVVIGVAQDAQDASNVSLIVAGSVRHSSNGGDTWADVTGDLDVAVTGGFNSLLHVPADDDGLVLGTDRGVFIARASSGFSSWFEVGSILPNTPVYDLDYDPADDRLIAATLGRGSFQLLGISGLGITNQAPVAEDDQSTTDEDSAVDNIAVLDNDADPDMDSLSVADTDTTGTVGIVTLNGDDTYRYDPNGQFESLGAGQIDFDSFSYSATDGAETDAATVAITINGVNDPSVFFSTPVTAADTG
ncbi:MAG: Ig-like domain-containing protein [Wenzhouxiangellaceae bacterium]